MSEQHFAVYRHGQIELDGPTDWPSGTRVTVTPIESADSVSPEPQGNVIIAGFGLAGRYIADLLASTGIDYVVVEKTLGKYGKDVVVLNKLPVNVQHLVGQA